MDKRISPLATISFLFLAPLALFLPVFLRWKGIFHNDQAMSEWIHHYFFAQNFQKGIFPLWDPHIFCGALPHYSYVYSGENYYFLLWPFSFLANLNNLDNAYWLLCLLPLFLHYFIAIGGMFLLLKRVIKCNWIASFVGAFTYMYSPVFAYAYVSQDNLIMQAWLPWLLYLYMESIKKFSPLKLFLGAFIFAFIWFGGKLQYMPYIMFIWLGFVILAAVENYRRGENNFLIKPIGTAFLIFILGTALSAVYLLSVIDGLKFTKLHLDLGLANATSYKIANMPLRYLITLFLPNFYGNITGQDFIFDDFMFYWANMSAGMVTTFIVFLAALSPIVIFSRKAQERHQLKYIYLGVFLYLFSIFCAMGGNTPFYRMLIGWIPVVSIMPYPIRYRMIQCFAAGLLFALGLHFLTSMDLSSLKFRLRKLAWVYITVSFLAITTVLVISQKKDDQNAWLCSLDVEAKYFLSLKEPAGLYTSKTARVKKVRLMFDGPSQGEIRFADTSAASPMQGVLVKNYTVAGKGWVEFDVDVAPNKFLWVLPLSGDGRIGYWKERDHGFFYDKGWHINPCTCAINIYNESHSRGRSLFSRLISGHVEKRPVVSSIFYWVLSSVFILLAIRKFSLKRFGYLAGAIIMLESSFFGIQAFYGCTFNERDTNARAYLPHNARARFPSEHPMYKEMITKVFPITASDMRITTDYPFYENFVYLNSGFAFMGDPPYPLERRFKRAIEAVYKKKLDEGMYYEGGGNLPYAQELLDNFSVKYFFSRSAEKVFNEEQCILVNGKPDKYIHVNPGALPRVYTVNAIVPKSDEEAFNALVSGNLREAAYISPDESGNSFVKEGREDLFSFEELQNKNPVQKIDFSDPNQVKIDIAASVASMLVLTDVWFPGWKAFDGARPRAIYRINYCQRGIWLEKGLHHICLKFQPLAWKIGLIISLSAAFCMTVFLIISFI